VLIHPWDAALDDDEWRAWLADGHDFGQLAVNGLRGQPPTVIPTHFTVDDTPAGTQLLIHLARPNPVWADIDANPHVVVTVIDDYAYIPTTWRAKAGGPAEDGVPTSYYAAVQFRCVAEVVDDPAGKADLLTRQLAHFQPAGDHAEVTVDAGPYGRMLSGIRGLRLQVTGVDAKFKYDDHNPAAHRTEVASRLTGRSTGRDVGAADQQRRRLGRIGSWRAR
jgi:transcriptional regulator